MNKVWHCVIRANIQAGGSELKCIVLPCNTQEYPRNLIPPLKVANYGSISKFKVSMEVSWQNASIYYVNIYKNQNKLRKWPNKISFAKIWHDYKLSRGKIWLWLLNRGLRLYYGAERGGGTGRVWEEGGEGIVGISWMFNAHGSIGVCFRCLVFVESDLLLVYLDHNFSISFAYLCFR